MFRTIVLKKIRHCRNLIDSLVTKESRSYSVIRNLAEKSPELKKKPTQGNVKKENHLSAVAELFLNEKGYKVQSQTTSSHLNEEEDSDIDTHYDMHDESQDNGSEEQNPLKYAEGELENFVEDVVAVPHPRYQTNSSSQNMSDFNMGTPDPTVPMSNIPCIGCGAFLHCTDQSIPGYLPSQKFTAFTKQQMMQSLCQRCNLLENYHICLDVKSTEDEFKSIIDSINEQIALIVLIVDITDIRNSLMPNLFKLIKGKNRPIFVVGNKIDSIPMDERYYLKRIRTQLWKEVRQAGLNPQGNNIRYLSLISAKTGYGVEDLVTNLMVQWRHHGNVYLIGNTNVGKSTLFNALLQSDYCKSRAREIVHRATVSVWPGTTINTLKFPIINPKSWRIQKRQARILRDKNTLTEERNLQKLKVQQSLNLRNKWKSATLTGYLGITDFEEDEYAPKRYDMAAIEMKEDSIMWNVGRDHLLEVPQEVNFENERYQTQNRWLFDTPGVICEDQIINLLTPPELVRMLPKAVQPPKVYLLKPHQTMFITAMGRIDYLEGEHNLFMTVHVTSNIKAHIMKTEEADEFYEQYNGTSRLQVPVGDEDRMESIPALVGKEYHLEDFEPDHRAIADIQLSSLGWVSVAKYQEGAIKLRAYTPGARGLYLRQPALIPQIKSFRGERIRGTQTYRTKPPKMPY